MEEHGVKIHETESVKASDGFAASAGDSLEKHGAHALDGFRPDPTDYFASLVQAANAAGLLSETDVSSLRICLKRWRISEQGAEAVHCPLKMEESCFFPQHI